MQQQLARLQVSLEQTHADFNGLGESRARAELDADAAKRRYNELKSISDALQKRLVKNEAELNSLQETLRQVRTAKPQGLFGGELKKMRLVQKREMARKRSNHTGRRYYYTSKQYGDE